MESPAFQQLFVYSSLRKGFHEDAYNYITQFFSFVCPAKAKGILSDLGNQLVATPTPGNSFIKGELYRLERQGDFSWVFGQLDDYEGLIPTGDDQPLYRRELTKIYKDDRTVTDAWIYWYNGDISSKPVVDCGDIMNYVESEKL